MPLMVVVTKRLCAPPIAAVLVATWALWCVFEVLVHRHFSFVHVRPYQDFSGWGWFVFAAAEICWLPHALPLLRSLRAGRFTQAFRRCVDSLIGVVAAVTLGVLGRFVSVVLYCVAFSGVVGLVHDGVQGWSRVNGLPDSWTAMGAALTALVAGGVIAAHITASLAPQVGHYRYGVRYRCASAGCCGLLLAGTTSAAHHPLVAGVCLIAASLFSLPWLRHPDEPTATCGG